ncbi:hypothetical protein B0H67DRAFT_363978 [Lasiosphaeris hirsuta]|uniref:Uncharacterized protein n=1 Tax=Lasiosphaeris hirsuta TaxID=260670 RepID=A0AA40DIZ1_9PEZI|nr:hypothetical protein B0H67DRAFT_363978 [Lasiosphaeris hirsuta]
MEPHSQRVAPWHARESVFPPHSITQMASRPRATTSESAPAVLPSSTLTRPNILRKAAPSPKPPKLMPQASFAEFPLPGRGFRDHLEPDNPHGYLQPSPFNHNWEQPNRQRARSSADPRRVYRAGYFGPPIGSKPGPGSDFQFQDWAGYDTGTTGQDFRSNTPSQRKPQVPEQKPHWMCDKRSGMPRTRIK